MLLEVAEPRKSIWFGAEDADAWEATASAQVSRKTLVST